MLTHPTHDRLIALGLTGMAKALEDQRRQPDVATLPFEERLAMMIDREAIERENKRLERRLKAASLRQSAIVEDIDHKAPRGLDRALFQKLIAGELEIIDDRHGRGSTIVTSQLPVDHWHEVIANPTIADAILDRLVHNAHRLTLKGDSMRKIAAKRSGLDASPAL